MFVTFSVFYILVAIAMIVLILLQRGQGADAGASFGGGSSGTVFGASGSVSFMGRVTGGLALVFFIMSLGMAVYLAHSGAPKDHTDLGVMSGAAAQTSSNEAATPAAGASAGQHKQATAVPTTGQPAADKKSQQTGKQEQGANAAVPAATDSADNGSSAAGNGNKAIPDPGGD